MKNNFNSFDLVKDQQLIFENFKPSYLCKARDKSPNQSDFILSQTNFNENNPPFVESFSSRKESKNKSPMDNSKNGYSLRLSSFLKEKQSENLENDNLEIPSLIKNIEKKQDSENPQEISGFSPVGNNFTDVYGFCEKNQENYQSNLLDTHLLKEDSTVLPFVKRFIAKLKNSSCLRDISQMGKRSFALFSDKAYFSHEKEKNEKKNLLKGLPKIIYSFKEILEWLVYRIKRNFLVENIENCLKKHNLLIHPYQNIKILWDIFHLFLIILWFFLIPLIVAFDEIKKFDISPAEKSVFFLLFDCFLKFNTCYFKNGIVEKNRLNIIKNYILEDFFIDIITIVPMFIYFLGSEFSIDFNEGGKLYQFLPFIFFIKIRTFKEITHRILEKFLLKEKFQNILSLFKVLFISVLIAHLFACSWYFIANNSNSQNNWLKDNGVIDESWDIKYLYSMYWACITMMTVGYGDITPTNNLEFVFCLITVVLGCAVYAYNINSIGMILQDLNKENAEFNHKINIINQFMKRKNIKKELQMRIREYLRFIWKEENAQNLEDEQKIIGFLSGSLKEELLIEAYGEILKKFPMFFANFTEKSLKKVVDIIKDIKFFPEEKIFQEKDEENLAIYFIMKGKVQLITESGIVVQELGVGEHFGEISFFSGKPRILAAKTKDFTTIFAINRDDFIRVLKQNPEDFEKFSMIKDQISIYENYYPLKIRCFSCNQMGHLATNCHLLHFLPDKEKVIKKYNFYTDQERQAFNRKHIRRNAFNYKRKLEIASQKIRNEKKKEKEIILQFVGSDMSLNSSDDLDDDIMSEDDVIENTISTKNKSLPNTLTDKQTYEEPSENLAKENENNLEKESFEDINVNSMIKALNDNSPQINTSNNNMENSNMTNYLNANANLLANYRSSDATLEELRLQMNKEANVSSLLRIPDVKSQKKLSKDNEKTMTKKIKKKYEGEFGKKFSFQESSNNDFSMKEGETDFFIAEMKSKSQKQFEEIEDKKEPVFTNTNTNSNKKNPPKENSAKHRASSLINVKGSKIYSSLIAPVQHPLPLEKTACELDKVANFKTYFPENNSTILLQKVNSKENFIKYSKMKKEKKKSYENRLSKYTFFLDEMKERMPDSIKKRKKLSSLKRKAILTNSEKSNGFSFDWKSFHTFRERNKLKALTFALLKGENKFSDLVKLVLKNQILKKKLKKKN